MFQLTAARRRLDQEIQGLRVPDSVSTHSRPKAAGTAIVSIMGYLYRFQLTAARRRLGSQLRAFAIAHTFQLTAARRRLDVQVHIFGHDEAFQLTAARRRLVDLNDT